MTRATIAALSIYPIKGCRGVAVNDAMVSVRGLVRGTLRDREWMVVDAHGRFVSQREHPRLALVDVHALDDGVALRAPGMPPLDVVAPAVDGAVRMDVVVWSSTVAAIDAGDDAARWLAGYLGAPGRLVRFAPEHVRACNPDVVGASGANTMFADGYPLLVIGEASLAELNRRLAGRRAQALPMNRFRPNIVVTGTEAHDEDHINTLEADGVVLKLVKPCVRCQVTTTDQDDASAGDEPLATLAGYRMDERFGGVTFGMNAIVVAGAGRTLAAGTSVAIDYRF